MKIKIDAGKWFDEHEKELREDLRALVRIPSISVKTDDPKMPYGKACKEVLDACLALGARMGFMPYNHENYCGTVLWKGEVPEEIGFFGHADVVPAGEGWSYEPFEMTELPDGILVGRGVSDNKGSFLTALYALRCLKENGYKPKHSMRFFFGCSEETTMEDLEYYAAHYPQPVFSLIADYRFPGTYGEKGLLEVDAECRKTSEVLRSFSAGVMSNAVPAHAEAVIFIKEHAEEITERFKKLGAEVMPLETEMAADEMQEKAEDRQEMQTEGRLLRVSTDGIPAHAAFPEGSESAEVKLADILLRSEVLDEGGRKLMEAVTHFFRDYYGAGLNIAYEDKESGKLTHVGGIASYRDGIFRQNINIRYSVTADRSDLVERLTKEMKLHGFTVTGVRGSNPCYVDPSLPPIQKLAEIANRILGTDLKPIVIGGGTYARKLKNAIAYGMGMPVRRMPFGKTRGGAHQADEYAEIGDFRKAFIIYIEAIQALDEMI